MLVSSDAAFSTALDDALVPAGMAVVTVGEAAAPSIGELSAESRRLADREHATATVWLLPAPTGATLVTYDRNVDRLLVRELPYAPPLSPTQAAEAARMVRTMLRALRVTPDSDQLPAPMKIAPPAPPPPSPPWLAIDLGGGAWFAAPAETSALAGYAAVVWRPQGFGAAVTGDVAPEAGFMTPAFVGRVRDIVVAAEARKAFEVHSRIHIAPTAGVALHLIELHGDLVEGAPVDSHSYDPALRLGATAHYSLPRGIEIGLAVSGDCLLRRQRYEVGNEEILTIPRIQVLTRLIVGIRL